VIGKPSVDLFWHFSVEAPESGFDMSDFDILFARCETPSENGVRVTLDDDDIY
jgi:hypothetical protein